MVWIPPAWEEAAQMIMVGLGERQPSRTIRLFPDPGAERNRLDAEVDLQRFARGRGRAVCSEVIAVWLRGTTARAPASVVQPLLVPDLPVFLRWRGNVPFGSPELDGLAGVADRLIVDTREWEHVDADLAGLAPLLPRIAVSDITWARVEPWRRAIAGLWPQVAAAARLRVVGPRADALLLHRWLRARLELELELEHEPAGDVELVEVDGHAARVRASEPAGPVELLSEQLEIHGRDQIYEEAVRG